MTEPLLVGVSSPLLEKCSRTALTGDVQKNGSPQLLNTECNLKITEVAEISHLDLQRRGGGSVYVFRTHSDQ